MPGDVQRVGADIGRRHLRPGEAQGDGNGQRARARAQIQHALAPLHAGKRLLAQRFGVVAGNQRAGLRAQRNAHKLRRAQDVLQRLALAAAIDQRLIIGQLRLRQLPPALGAQQQMRRARYMG